MNILIVEDKDQNIEAAKKYFEQQYDSNRNELFFAKSLTEALGIMESRIHYSKAWIVISDLNIPYNSELELKNSDSDYPTSIHGELVAVKAAVMGVPYITISEHGGLVIYQPAEVIDKERLAQSELALTSWMEGDYDDIDHKAFWGKKLRFSSKLSKTKPQAWDIAYTLIRPER